MKWLERMRDCIDYIEGNIKKEIDIDELCKIACLSKFYLYRMFSAVTGITITEYIRNRKMSMAAKDLFDANKKVIDIAFDYGYSSPEAFSRAFKSIHGISPSYGRLNKSKLKSYAPISFQISIKGDVEMNYKIEHRKAFKVLGKSITTTNEDNKNYNEIPNFWRENWENGTMKELFELTNGDNHNMGICMACNEGSNEFLYYIAVPCKGDEISNYKMLEIPEADWAIFECVGAMPKAIQSVWGRIFSEWLPATGYEIAPLPQIEFYYPGDPSDENYKSEVWIPIIK